MIDTPTLNQLVFDAFTGKMTWLQASGKFPLDEFIEAFRRTRATMQKQLDGLTDAQASFTAESVPTWSLSETVTHLVFSQGFYYNALLDITETNMPHLIEAAKGFGEGSRRAVPAEELRGLLQKATLLMTDGIEKTRVNSDPARIAHHPFFGEVNYQTWVLLTLAHEIDHVRQSIVMRRLARAAPLA